MVTLEIRHPGPLATVQDLGRPGFAAMGVPLGGAFDAHALRLGNRLLGNVDDAAAIELTLGAARVLAHASVVAAITGAPTTAVAQHATTRPRPVPWGRPFSLQAGEELRFGHPARGVRTYLCVSGGLVVPRLLGSASTCLPGGFGGPFGRPLQAGDRLIAGPPVLAPPECPATSSLLETPLGRDVLRAVDGGHVRAFGDEDSRTFWTSSFTVAAESDRTGVRLLSARPVQPPFHGRMPSEGMPPGAVQIPQSGHPIILGVDHPTTGGFPVIATVITADLPALAQLRPGDRVRFERVTVDQAIGAYRDQIRSLEAISPRNQR